MSSDTKSCRIVIEGSVLKSKIRQKKMTAWKNRWLTLYEDGTLRYYAGARSKGGKEKGVIRLSECQSISDECLERDNCCKLQLREPKDVAFFFSFESDWLKKSWMRYMDSLLQKPSADANSHPMAIHNKRTTLMHQIRSSWNFTAAVKSGYVLVAFNTGESESARPIWVIRFVVLSRGHLFCYKQKPTGDGNPEEQILLDSSCRICDDPRLEKAYACKITMDTGMSLAMAFDSKTIKDGWVESISSSCIQSHAQKTVVQGIQSVYTVRATEDYTPSGRSQELVYNKEDIITVLELDPSNWYHGQIGDRVGYFDATKTERFGQVVHVRIIQPHTPEGPTEMAVSVGEILEIVAISEAGWLKGHRLGDVSFGWFPAGYAEVVEDERAE
eukprot:TRINITY_DN56_c0_g2_i1.p1 TRINITY_DN56_c0_g2~~TRINITY_DN56_c0_g2_i1.p1  ORF type:complete len:386 (+),score=71.99 TRINITY_DN56_c0_g2_i1:111-1268(+)